MFYGKRQPLAEVTPAAAESRVQAGGALFVKTGAPPSV
jgi:hypothetical protein